MPSEPEPKTIEESNDPDGQIWAIPMPGEDANGGKWFTRFTLYAGLGAARSVRAVYNAELAQRGKASEHSKPVPSSWTQKSREFRWVERAEAFDTWQRKQIFGSGNAKDTERIKALDELINQLRVLIVAGIAKLGKEPEIDIDGLTKLITALLKAIDLMAKLTGGYAPSTQRIEHTGKDGGKIEVEETKFNVVFYMPDVEPIDQVEIGDGADHGEASEVSGDSQ